MTVHAINKLNTTYADTTFYSGTINQVIYSQFYLVLIFYIFSHIYLASTAEYAKYFFILYFLLTSILFVVFSFYSSSSTMWKIMGGFSLVMILIDLALQAIKSHAKSIFGFISSIIVAVLWIFIIFPYVVMIPFISIFVDQNRFGNFVYGCILATVVLLIFLVGILTLVFNKLIDKYEE